VRVVAVQFQGDRERRMPVRGRNVQRDVVGDEFRGDGMRRG
jgi:hypothetical protein